MAIFLNELNPFRLYRGQYYYPIDLKDRTHNSIVYLMTPNTESSINILNNRLAKLNNIIFNSCLLYTSPSPRDRQKCRMPSSA